jgi:carbon monoxide dehydrogenase subunit G
MELNHDFTVNVPIDEAWRLLTDLERIAPCMPGAELQEIQGDEYRGIVKVKVGPITAQYAGKATFQSQDRAAGQLVVRAEGRDTRGQGSASATITASLEAAGEGTKVTVVTDLSVTGKVAQFGRGVLADVSSKLLSQFVDRLESEVIAAGQTTPDASVGPAATSADPASVRAVHSKPAEPVDLGSAAAAPLVKRAVPALGLLVVVLWLLRRRS